MTPERHQQIKQLFLAAVELKPADAERFLAENCGADAILRAEVQSLLDHHLPDHLLPDNLLPTQERASETTGIAAGFPGTAQLPQAHDRGTTESFTVRPPGTIVAGRYRLVASLGEGGMGIIYRAEDLELGQTVALKFLHPRLQEFQSAVELLRSEVRIAREVSHPNVVRVFDLGVVAGEVFISMEYVDGEDLASLVRRIGRLPSEKLRTVARQLAAGLAAAHDRGVLHRDLKPTNVMIDGSGKVRIVDFGISAAIHDHDALSLFAGTPGFVAPEVCNALAPSAQSDLYAWGVVVYYAATGTMPPVNPTDEKRNNDSELDEDVSWESNGDFDLQRLVATCLDPNPDRRPRSASELVVALSAGDPLSVELRAGRLPTSDLVLAADSWQPSSKSLNSLLATGMFLFFLVSLLADRTLFLSRCGLVKSPAVLQELAERTLHELGSPVRRNLVLTGVALDADCFQYLASHPELVQPWDRIREGRVPAVFYWYRQGDPRLPRPAPLGDPAWERMAPPIPGTSTVRLDGHGRLLSLQVALATANPEASRSGPIDWGRLFELAGLRVEDFRASAATRLPPLFAHDVYAWQGPHPAYPELELKITAATLAGRVVFFDVDHPWEQERPFDAMYAFEGITSWLVSVRTGLWFLFLVLAVGVAVRNIRRGQVDWGGAVRVSVGVAILSMIDWLLGSPHSLVISEELTIGLLWINDAVFSGAMAGAGYLAVEPLARRNSPWSIITTRRFLSGRISDRGIWSDLLVGLVAGLAVVLFLQVAALASSRLVASLGGLHPYGLGLDLLNLFGLRYKVSVLNKALLVAVIEALLLLSFLIVSRRVTKSTPATVLIFITVLTSVSLLGHRGTSLIDGLLQAMVWGIAAFILVRPGLLATIAAMTTAFIINSTPVTTQFSTWYAPTSLFVQSLLVAGLIISWWMARPKPVRGSY